MLDIDLSKIKKEYLLLVCSALIVVIAFFAYRNIISPFLGRIKKVSSQIEQKKMNIQKARISPQTLDSLKDQISKLKRQIDYYQNRLIDKADVPQILKELNRLAERLQIKFVSISPLEREETLLPGEEGFLVQIPIRIKLRCGYHQLGIFINQIENASRFMKITDLKISADSRNIWQHQAELVITSYNLFSK